MFLLGPPSLSSDVLSYIAHGSIATELGGNPYLQPEAVVGTPVEPELLARGWGPGHSVSPYGPLWTGIEAAVVAAFGHVSAQIFAFKELAMAAGLGTAALISDLTPSARAPPAGNARLPVESHGHGGATGRGTQRRPG